MSRRERVDGTEQNAQRKNAGEGEPVPRGSKGGEIRGQGSVYPALERDEELHAFSGTS